MHPFMSWSLFGTPCCRSSQCLGIQVPRTYQLTRTSENQSLKKLNKEDSCMSTSKTVLGWNLDTGNMTVHLTQRCHQCLLAILDDILQTWKQISITRWHKVLSELRSMSLALTGSRRLCGALQACFKFDRQCVCLMYVVLNFLDNVHWIAGTLHNHPTHACEVVPTSPMTVGSTIASDLGMGGTCFIPTPWFDTTMAQLFTSHIWCQPHKQWM